ncbi:MAG: DUF4126 domain-containing protein [Novosphingobium sp.]|nr:DUF4126 domain-containing protein [Novosphingobium sp.]
MTILVLALVIGIVAGLRAMVAPAAVALGGWLGWVALAGTPLAFLGNMIAVAILMLLALGELVSDQLPTTPSRKVPVQFGGRILTGALSGAAIGASGGQLALGAVAGAIGAVIGTLGGASARGGLATAFGSDRPAAILEDLVAIGLAFAVIAAA